MPLPDGLRQDDVETAYPTTVATVLCGDKTGRSSQRKWKASTRVRKDGEDMLLGDWIIQECNLRKADLPAVGQMLQVYWPLDRAWYSGRVLSYTKAQGSTQVVYDDGDVEMLHMVMERYRVSPDNSRALQVMPSPDDVIDLSSAPNDVIDLSISGDLDAVCPYLMPQLTSVAAKFPDSAVASQLVVKKEANEPMTAAQANVLIHAPAEVQRHADHRSPGLASEGWVQSPGSVSKPHANQLIQGARLAKHMTKASASQHRCADPSATAPAVLRSNTLKATVAKHIQQGGSQVATGTARATPAQTAAELPQAQHGGSQTCRSKPAAQERGKDLHDSKSDKGAGLKSVLKPSKRLTLHQVKPNGLRPLPDRPAKAPQHAQQAQHGLQAQQPHQLKKAQQAHQIKRGHLNASVPQTPQTASLWQKPHSASVRQEPQNATLEQEPQSAGIGQQPEGASLRHRTQAVMHAEGLTAGVTVQPGTASQEGGPCEDAQHKAKRIKLEADTQQQQHHQQVQKAVQHEASLSEAATLAIHIPEANAAAQTAVVVADRLPLQLLQQFGLGVNLDAAQKQTALEELVLSVADAGVTARFFANLDKHGRAEAEQNLSRYYRSISVLVQSTRGQHQVADVIRTYIDSLCQA